MKYYALLIFTKLGGKGGRREGIDGERQRGRERGGKEGRDARKKLFL